jgi:hypothetical protein
LVRAETSSFYLQLCWWENIHMLISCERERCVCVQCFSLYLMSKEFKASHLFSHYIFTNQEKKSRQKS